MCDYSLEAFKSVSAEKGQTYTLGRFPSALTGVSGSKGFTADDCGTAACMPEGMKLQLRGLDVTTQATYSIGPDEVVEFIHLPVSWGYRDAVRFAGGTEVKLQDLNEGCTASLYVELADRMGLDQIRADIPVVDPVVAE